MLPTPLQCFEYRNKKLICKNNPVITGEANVSAKGTKLRHKMWLYPNCNSVVLQFKQDTTLCWKKSLRVLAVREMRALLIRQIEGLCAIPFSNLLQQKRGGGDRFGPYSYSWLETKS